VLLLAASSFAAAQTTAPNKSEQELRAVHQQINESFNRADKATLERLIADHYIVSTVSGLVVCHFPDGGNNLRPVLS
jgi:hypothetical protein